MHAATCLGLCPMPATHSQPGFSRRTHLDTGASLAWRLAHGADKNPRGLLTFFYLAPAPKCSAISGLAGTATLPYNEPTFPSIGTCHPPGPKNPACGPTHICCIRAGT